MKNKFIVTIFLTVAAFILFSERIFACAPGFPSDVYESKDILGDYYPLVEGVDSETSDTYPILNQKYEVITPGWGSEYLLPVYFAAEGKELSKEIKDMLFRYYKRLGYSSTPLYRVDNTNSDKDEEGTEKPMDRWLKIRNMYFDNINDTEKEKLFRNDLNLCPDQIFDKAVEDYEYRKTKFSETELSSWVKSQDKVFQNCIGGKAVSNDKISKTQSFWQSIIVFFRNINKKPVPLDSIPATKVLEYDQEYQQAASAYYSNDFSLASKLFRKIINNKSHPHRQLAALSLGWTYIGADDNNYELDLKAEKTTAEDNRIKNLKQTQKYYEELVSNSDYASVKNEAQKYLDFVLFRTDPVRRLIEAEKVLLNPSDDKEFVRQLDDFNHLWYKYFQRVLINQKEEVQHKEFSGEISASQSPFLRFLMEWEKPSSETIQYSLENYKNNNNPLWLILALRQSDEGQKDLAFIKEEIGKIKPESPFYLTAQYYSLEQLVKAQKNEEAKTIAEKYIKETYSYNQLSAFNLFSDIRENLSSDPKDAFKFSTRYSVAVYDKWWDSISTIPYYSYAYRKYDNSKKDLLLSNKTKLYLSSLNPADLSKFVIENSASMQDSLKRYLKLTAFNRSFVLEDLESADLLAIDITKTDPILSANFNQYLSANSDAAKKFMAAKILVDYPRVFPQIGDNLDELANAPISYLKSINSYRRNWVSSIACTKDEYKPDDFTETEIDKKVADKNSVNYLLKTIVDYIIQNPSYSDPELLHQVVDVGHYAACQDSETSNIAKQAFQLLHTEYPNNYWTNQTPYWY